MLLVSRRTVDRVRSDRGTEFVRAESVELLDRRGIRREQTSVGSPKHNGLVERQIAMTLELLMAPCLDTPRLFSDARLTPTEPLEAEAGK